TGTPHPGVAFPEAFEREVQDLHADLGAGVPAYLLRRLLLDAGSFIEGRFAARFGSSLHARLAQPRQHLAGAGCQVRAVEARTRYQWIREAVSGCVQRPAQRPVSWTDRLDRVLTHRVWGTLIFLVMMFIVFQSIFTWARPLMKLINSGKDFCGDGLRDLLPPG